MPLPLHQSDAINSAASLLYDFLPGSGDRGWTGHTTFATVAQAAGVGDFWPGGSKQKALVRLLTRTLEERQTHFEKLIVTIVREGLTYRTKNPVTKSEILALNELIKKLGFKFPDLWDPRFLDSLAAKVTPAPDTTPVPPPPNLTETRRKLEQLRLRFYSLASQADRNAAGTAFQRLFGELLELFGLSPKPAYRVVGEEIDGHFVLDHETYLVETKWESGPLSEAPLLAFRGKVEGKSNISRGVFVAANGYSTACLTAIRVGKQPNFFLLDGYDIAQVLEGQIDLDVLLREKLRVFAAKGDVLARIDPELIAR